MSNSQDPFDDKRPFRDRVPNPPMAGHWDPDEDSLLAPQHRRRPTAKELHAERQKRQWVERRVENHDAFEISDATRALIKALGDARWEADYFERHGRAPGVAGEDRS